MNWLTKIKKRLSLGMIGYTCDCCGVEVFRYPRRRLCNDCQAKIFKNDGSYCEKCGRAMPVDGVCLACKRSVPNFVKAASPIIYFMDGGVLVNRFKEGSRYLAAYFAEEMWKVLDRLELPEPPLLIAVPTTEDKLQERGYNPSEELAKELARLTGYEFSEGVLVKFGDGAQKHRSSKEREEQIRGSIRVKKRKACRDRVILVVDDVMTTGATGKECARVLMNTGAKSVYLIAACAVPQKRD